MILFHRQAAGLLDQVAHRVRLVHQPQLAGRVRVAAVPGIHEHPAALEDAADVGHALMFVGLVLWTVSTDGIKPRLIPADDIARVADDIIASYANPELEAFARHERAWYDSDGAEQTYWYRVRKAVRSRLETGR